MFPLLVRHILVWITNGILWFIVTPFGIYNLCLYYKYSDKLALNKRHYATVVCLVVFILIFWTVERGIGLIWSSQIFGESFTLTLIHYTIFSFTIYGILWSLVWRYWLVYYDISFAISTSQSRWKSILNPKNDETVWFIVHKKTFGNQLWTFKCCIFVWLIISISSILFHLMAVLQIYPQRIATLLDGAMNLLSFMLLYMIWFKTPKFEDKLWIRFELKVIMYAYMILYIWYFVGSILSSLFYINEFVFNIISSWIAVIITNVFVYICTRWILDKFVFNISCDPSVSVSNSFSGAFSPKHCITVSDSGTHLKLHQLLTQYDGLSCFMDHLLHEFAHECLLSFIEMVQWKTSLNNIIIQCQKRFQYEDIEPILSLNQVSNDANGQPHIKQKSESVVPLKKDVSVIIRRSSHFLCKSHTLLCAFPDKIPLSSIVADWKYDGNINPLPRTNVVSDIDDDIDDDESVLHDNAKIICDYKIKAYGLYRKYICNGCEMEINIHCQTRNGLYRLMTDLEEWMKQDICIIDLYVLFDEAIQEMYKLMQDSFKRFKHSQEYVKLDHEILSSIKSFH